MAAIFFPWVETQGNYIGHGYAIYKWQRHDRCHNLGIYSEETNNKDKTKWHSHDRYKMKKYENYKDSGVEWIGEIPQSWDITRIGVNSELTVPQRDKPKDLTGPIPWLRIEDFDDKYVSVSKTNQGVTQETVDSMNLKVYPVGTVLTACSCTMGMTAIVEKPLITNQTFIGITPLENLDSVYLFYFLKASTQYLNSISSGAIQSYLSRSEFSKLRIPKISLIEQTQIANFLDHKTTQIDTLISKKQQFISLLQEERIAVINQAVTKGLDPKVKMKDSGIEWLGEIPEHWEVKKLKFIKSNIKNAFVDGPFGSNLKTEHFVENGEVYVIDSGLITSGVFHKKREMKTITKEHFETVLRSECKQNDIIIAKIGANFGMSGILPKLDKLSLVSGNTLKLTVNEELYDLKLIHLQLLNLKTQGEIDLLVKGSAQPALSMGAMSDLPFVIPDTKEVQVTIRDYILNQHKRIDKLITKSQQEIELLKEYKTALISEVVTGKVDVRDVVLN